MTRTASYSSADIARFAIQGRRLQGRAIRTGFFLVGRWLFRAVSGAIGRRATVRLGCSDCSAHA